jgi:membrane protein YdbS with pleckstrin-like domain
MVQKIKKKTAISKKKLVSPFNIYWDKKNYLFLFLGFALLVVGYYVMSIGSWDSTPSLILSPIILVIAYILIFPMSIFAKKKETVDKSKEELK